ncbi:hypothetical protein KEJ26_01795 [Candidatus Bathyarchaeota archaeon]|nr:hypothetical protein [Candidatus Bathyarchaeota archaeon]
MPLQSKIRVKIAPTTDVRVLGLDRRTPDALSWCAVTFGVNRLFWIDGYLLCLEVYDKAFEYEVERGFFPISQVCYSPYPNYNRVYEVKKGTEIPVTDASDMQLYQAIVAAIKACKRLRET